MDLPDGLIAVVKRDCPTCLLVEPVLQAIDETGAFLTVYTQDDPAFPAVKHRIDDTDLERSFHLDIETVPTLIRMTDGRERARAVGWERGEWSELAGVEGLGEELPPYRPGCGSLSVEPGIAERLALRYGAFPAVSRRIEVPVLEDATEYCFERGWSDGLPVVPPTEERLYRMLNGTRRAAGEVLGKIPPNLVPLTVEKVALNAVMAGCKPEYLPTVLAAAEAALEPTFCLHGLLATTWFSAPMVIVNGPVRAAIGMNWRGNVLGQGNRANATIGRALQLVVRNVGGGRPQEADQSTFGTPGKFTFCFAEDDDTPWQTLAEERGFTREQSTVTLFSADGVQGVVDQNAREPEALIRSIAASLHTVDHVAMANAADAVVVVGPEHGRVFDAAGWTKAEATAALHEHLRIPGRDLGMGTDDSAATRVAEPRGDLLPKFRPGGLQLIRAGGNAGLFSAIIPGWLMKGPLGTDPVTREIQA
ncbi:MAG TPA: thioredoxin [Gammaproteobacteria bacterium]|nr:thioredoxin [Gammaproteobacteria bacterium]